MWSLMRVRKVETTCVSECFIKANNERNSLERRCCCEREGKYCFGDDDVQREVIIGPQNKRHVAIPYQLLTN